MQLRPAEAAVLLEGGGADALAHFGVVLAPPPFEDRVALRRQLEHPQLLHEGPHLVEGVQLATRIVEGSERYARRVELRADGAQ